MENNNSRVNLYESFFLLQHNDKSLGEDYSFSEGMLDEISITLLLMMWMSWKNNRKSFMSQTFFMVRILISRQSVVISFLMIVAFPPLVNVYCHLLLVLYFPQQLHLRLGKITQHWSPLPARNTDIRLLTVVVDALLAVMVVVLMDVAVFFVVVGVVMVLTIVTEITMGVTVIQLIIVGTSVVYLCGPTKLYLYRRDIS